MDTFILVDINKILKIPEDAQLELVIEIINSLNIHFGSVITNSITHKLYLKYPEIFIKE